jgi:hypothetical protein
MSLKTIAFSLLLLSGSVFAGQSTILNAAGEGCDEEKKQSEIAKRLAHTEAKRNAAERVQTFITSQSVVEDFALKEDIIDAYSTAEVKVLSVLSEEWDTTDFCLEVEINAEVTPIDGNLSDSVIMEQLLADPSAPLTVKVWTNKDVYSPNDTMQIYVKGNKPFYGMLTYKDSTGEILQILPNPNRKSNHFNGGVIYTIPGDGDTFDLAVEPPFGKESLSLYASTMPLGDVSKIDLGVAFKVKDDVEKIAQKTRGLKLVKAKVNDVGEVVRDERIAEFSQVSKEVTVEE